MKKYVYFFTYFLGILAYQSAFSQNDTSNVVEFKILGDDDLDNNSLEKLSAFWDLEISSDHISNLKQDEIEKLISLTSMKISLYNSKSDKKEKAELIDLDDYRSFFIPVIGSNDKKNVLVMSFCKKTSSEWMSLFKLLEKLEKSDCTFYSMINLENPKIEAIKTK